MERNLDYISARNMLLDIVTPVETENVPLNESFGRVLAEEIIAKEDVPPFDRSPYDGYVVRAVDSHLASEKVPVTLEILEEVTAGAVPTKTVTEGTATKILTGAPIPEGADAVIMYEKTQFTETTVTLTLPVKSGDNIIRAGEDVHIGQVLAEGGSIIDAGLAGSLASQGIARPLVYLRPKVGIISTGNEVVELLDTMSEGKIRNSNPYTLAAALQHIGCVAEYLGLAGDCVDDIVPLITKGLATCDAVLLTGGVSVGDYDFTVEAMEKAGVKLLVRGVDLKPGMACAYGIKDGKLVCGLSGNPVSSITNAYAVVLPAIKKLAGRKDAVPAEISVTLACDFKKKSKNTRLLRGKLDISDGTARMQISAEQGNVVISSIIGCDVMAVVPAGSGPLSRGTVLKGFLL